MKIEELLRDEEPAIVDEVWPAIAQLEHYRRDGAEAVRRRVAALYRHVARAVSDRELDDLLAHAARIARERFEGGFDLEELQAAFAGLEDAISRHALARLPKSELAWGLGLVSTALAHARGELGRTFVALPARPAAAVDLTCVFARGDDGAHGRPAEDLVYPV